jgi:hypothetical protein
MICGRNAHGGYAYQAHPGKARFHRPRWSIKTIYASATS